MPFCTWIVQAANGEPCRMSFHPGPQCGATSAPGATRDLEADAHGLARMGAPETRAQADSQRGDHRQPIGEDDTNREGLVAMMAGKVRTV